MLGSSVLFVVLSQDYLGRGNDYMFYGYHLYLGPIQMRNFPEIGRKAGFNKLTAGCKCWLLFLVASEN